jgi:6-pyruvoyltetrahydropterin/6-carboxytetrahydropterin synthase
MTQDAAADIVEIDLSKERMKFSAGHFTIFSATDRENLHGHNFTVSAIFSARLIGNGMVVDYAVLKDVVTRICDSLDEYFLLPLRSPHLQVREEGDHVIAQFGAETLQFLRRDVKLLPLTNITVEELSSWVLGEVRREVPGEVLAAIVELSVRVASGPGQGATVRWRSG